MPARLAWHNTNLSTEGMTKAVYYFEDPQKQKSGDIVYGKQVGFNYG
jgi:hypothetical protein